MRAFVVQELTHPSKVSLSYNTPEPKAGSRQILVDVYSAGLNFFDVCLDYNAPQLVFHHRPFSTDSTSTRKVSEPTPFAIYFGNRVRRRSLAGFTHS